MFPLIKREYLIVGKGLFLVVVKHWILMPQQWSTQLSSLRQALTHGLGLSYTTAVLAPRLGVL